jgi:hypothetical protein
MSRVEVFRCDGPDCSESCEGQLGDGWITATGGTITFLARDAEDKHIPKPSSHWCSSACLRNWADMMLAEAKESH